MIIVTGGAGFIGSAFIAKLNQQGIRDIIIVDSLGEGEKWRNLNGKRFFDYYHKSRFLNIVEEDTLDIEISAVIHLGACSSTTATDGEYIMSNNYRYTKVLADWALEKGARFIYASSAATYGDGTMGYSDEESTTAALRPLNLYGFSKHSFDLCAIETGAISSMVGLKFFNVYGPNEYHKGEQASVVSKGYDSIKKTGSLKLFRSHNPKFKDGEFYRDFIYVKDCVDVMWWLLQSPEVTGLFNLGTGKAESWNSLADALFKAMKLPSNIQYIDMPDSLKNHYQYHTEATMTKLTKAGWKTPFRTLADGVLDYVENHLATTNRYW